MCRLQTSSKKKSHDGQDDNFEIGQLDDEIEDQEEWSTEMLY